MSKITKSVHPIQVNFGLHDFPTTEIILSFQIASQHRTYQHKWQIKLDLDNKSQFHQAERQALKKTIKMFQKNRDNSGRNKVYPNNYRRKICTVDCTQNNVQTWYPCLQRT